MKNWRNLITSCGY